MQKVFSWLWVAPYIYNISQIENGHVHAFTISLWAYISFAEHWLTEETAVVNKIMFQQGSVELVHDWIISR
jgi:hypothetical protein